MNNWCRLCNIAIKYIILIVLIISNDFAYAQLLYSDEPPQKEIVVKGQNNKENVIFVQDVNFEASDSNIDYVSGVISETDLGGCFINPVMDFAHVGATRVIRKGRMEYRNFEKSSGSIYLGAFVSKEAFSFNLENGNALLNNNKISEDRVFILVDIIKINESGEALDVNSNASKMYNIKKKKKKLIFDSYRDSPDLFVCPIQDEPVSTDALAVLRGEFDKPSALVSLIKPTYGIRKWIGTLVSLGFSKKEYDRYRSEALLQLNKKNVSSAYNVQLVLESDFTLSSNAKIWKSTFNFNDRVWDKCIPKVDEKFEITYFDCSQGVRLNVVKPLNSSIIKPIKIGITGRNPKFPPIFVDSTPIGAEIYVGESRHPKQTRAEITILPKRTHLLRVEKTGFRSCNIGNGLVAKYDEENRNRIVGYNCMLVAK